MTYLVLALIIFCLVGVTAYALFKRQELESSVASFVREAEKRREGYEAELEAARLNAEKQREGYAADLEATKRRAEKQREGYATDLEAANQIIASLERFRHIPDIIDKAARTRIQIAEKLEKMQIRADRIIEEATTEAAKTIRWARTEAESTHRDAESVRRRALEKADQIIKDGTTEAAKTVRLARIEADSTHREARSVIHGALGRAEQILEQATVTATENLSHAKAEARSLITNSILEADSLLESAKRRRGELDADAQTMMLKAQAEVDAIHISVKQQEDELLADVRREVKEKGQKAEQALDRATIEAAEVVERAEKKAVEVAGKAYEALKRKEFYESAAEAMRNVTKGYGDRYMISGVSILDELAEEYGFDKAGDKLRLARERVKIMEKNRTAATCDYVETMRRELAINFVLDAFNGKVESILARVKHNNYGMLRQEIRDVFQLVNFNGKAFRDAQITEEFLNTRLDELKWAEAIQQLRLREKEEQRAIKEQIRDEEKARREYDRMIKQTQRDEDLLSKALEKARLEYDSASTEERAKYESRLLDLTEKLRSAEEKNRRAISMAQQTKRGYVYIISNVGSFGEEIYKIGLTRRLEPMDRVRELGDASVPFAFDVHALIYSENAPALESTLHKRFLQSQVNKVNRRKEFFRVNLREIRGVVEEMKYEARWTIASNATEYRETLALERKLRDDPEFRGLWLEDQARYESRIVDEGCDEPFEDEETPVYADEVQSAV